MSISSINTSTSSASSLAASTGTSASSSTTDTASMQDRFLKLLVAQINNQDPLSPMDNAQMTSQMAQINTVSGIQQVNQTLTSMAAQFTAMQVLQGTSMVGHNVLTAGSTLVPDPSTGMAAGAFDLTGAADAVKVEILAPSGQVLDTVNMGALPQGRQAFQWNAASYQGTGSPSFRVTATSGKQAVATTSLVSEQVVSVGAVNGAMSIQLQSGRSVGYTDIAAIL
jgi:flagellar basal-body rod modification protein FlgD